MMNKYIIDFINFKLNEALGIADATTYYTNRLTYKVFDEFYKVIDKMRSDKLSIGEVTKDIRLGYNDINKLVPKEEKNWMYTNFPVSEILITIDIKKKEEIEMGDSKVLVGGSASPFAKGREKHATRIKPSLRHNLDHTISVHIGIEILYSDDYKKMNTKFELFDRTYLFKKIESVISHELNHVYEYYMRRLSKSSKIDTSLTWTSIGENIYNIPEDIFLFWQNEFTNFIYSVEPHEINAQTQEVKIFTDKSSFDKFRKSKYWIEAKKMQNWSYKEFLNKLSDKFKEHNLPPSEIDKMKDIFVKEYIRLSTDWNESPKRIVPYKLDKMSNEEFYIFFEKIINRGGTKLIRNFCRLYALK